MPSDNTRTHPTPRVLAAIALTALAALASFASLALPPTPANGWLTYTYYDAEGEIVGQRSQGVCPGMQPVNWGSKTNRFTYQSGQCSGGGQN